jgi:hypothetical protein
LRGNCHLKRIIEGKIEGKWEGFKRRGRRRKQLFDDLKETRGYCKLKEEALDRTLWRTCFVRDYGPVVRLRNEWIKILSKRTQSMSARNSNQAFAVNVVKATLVK